MTQILKTSLGFLVASGCLLSSSLQTCEENNPNYLHNFVPAYVKDWKESHTISDYYCDQKHEGNRTMDGIPNEFDKYYCLPKVQNT